MAAFTTPSAGVMLLVVWNCLTAVVVPGPKLPSTVTV